MRFYAHQETIREPEPTWKELGEVVPGEDCCTNVVFIANSMPYAN